MASIEARNPAHQSRVVTAQEGVSQTYKAGDLLKFDSNGYVVIATAGAIHAIAKEDATGVTATVTEVEMLDFNELYVAYYKSSATAQNLVGQIADFTFTVGAHTLSESGGANDVVIFALDNRDALGTSGGRLLVRFRTALGTGI